MPKFKVTVGWSGYSRGHTVYEVEAATPQEAEECFYEGEEKERVVVRDDTERDEVKVEEIKE